MNGFTWVEAYLVWVCIYIFNFGPVCSIFICLGLFYRISAFIFFFGYTYIFLNRSILL